MSKSSSFSLGNCARISNVVGRFNSPLDSARNQSATIIQSKWVSSKVALSFSQFSRFPCTKTNNFPCFSLNFLFNFPPNSNELQCVFITNVDGNFFLILLWTSSELARDCDKRIRSDRKLKTFWQREKLLNISSEFSFALGFESVPGRAQGGGDFCWCRNERKTFFVSFEHVFVARCIFHVQFTFNKTPVNSHCYGDDKRFSFRSSNVATNLFAALN